jgi:hypothetical protein
MRPTVYIETSVVSYLAAHPSRDLITAAHQQITHTWWQISRSEFLIFASQVVLDESAAGDPQMASKRSSILTDVPLLDITPGVAELAAMLITRLPLPPRAGADALHIAVAAYHDMNFPADLELLAYCECSSATKNRENLYGTRILSSGAVYAGGAHWRHRQ